MPAQALYKKLHKAYQQHQNKVNNHIFKWKSTEIQVIKAKQKEVFKIGTFLELV